MTAEVEEEIKTCLHGAPDHNGGSAERAKKKKARNGKHNKKRSAPPSSRDSSLSPNSTHQRGALEWGCSTIISSKAWLFLQAIATSQQDI